MTPKKKLRQPNLQSKCNFEMARAQQNFHRHRTSSHGISLGGKDKIDGRIKAGREKKEEEERMKAIHEECNRKRVNEID